MKFEALKEIKPLFNGKDPFAVIDSLPGEVFRQLEQRRTQSFVFDGRHYFFKLHEGMSWAECLKNLSQGKLPVISAANEWHALNQLQKNGVSVAKPVAYADQMGWPPSRRSFIVMQAIENFIQMDDVFNEGYWTKITRQQQDKLIIEVARMTRAMHQQGVNHRDCYLCHFLLDRRWLENSDEVPPISLIDFHRARVKKPFPEKWRSKDIGALYYSAIDCLLSKRQLWLFIKTYRNYKGRKNFDGEKEFWLSVVERASAIYQRDFSKTPHHVFKTS